MKLFLRIAAVGLILFLVWAGLGFIRGNEAPAEIDFLLSVVVLPLWQGLMLAFALGWFAATLIFGWGWLRARFVTRRYRKSHAKLEAKLSQLEAHSGAPESDVDAGAESA